MRISDWSSDVCSSDLQSPCRVRTMRPRRSARRRGGAQGPGSPGPSAAPLGRDTAGLVAVVAHGRSQLRVGGRDGRSNGRASGRERGWQGGEILVVGVSLKKKKQKKNNSKS